MQPKSHRRFDRCTTNQEAPVEFAEGEIDQAVTKAMAENEVCKSLCILLPPAWRKLRRPVGLCEELRASKCDVGIIEL